jgi:uncharacterized protein YegL
MDMQKHINPVQCEKGEVYECVFNDASFRRFVIKKGADEKLYCDIMWEGRAKIRVICQRPDGSVLIDMINSIRASGLRLCIEATEKEGFYSIYLLPIAVPNSAFAFKIKFYNDWKDEIYFSQGRKLPIFLLIDNSRTMDNESIIYTKQIVDAVIKAFRNHPYMLESAYLSCITFDSEACLHSGLTPLMDFKEPIININTQENGNIAEGLHELYYSCKTMLLRESTRYAKRDWKGICCIFSNFLFPGGWDDPIINKKNKQIDKVVFLTSDKVDIEKAKLLSSAVCAHSDDIDSIPSSLIKSFWFHDDDGPVCVEEDDFVAISKESC